MQYLSLFAVITDRSHCYQYQARSSPTEHLQPLVTRLRRPQQSGFTRSRSTIDAILALRLVAELHREFGKPLQVAIHRHQGCLRFGEPPDSVESTSRHRNSTIPDPADPGPAHRHKVTSPESGGSCQKHFILPLTCGKGAFSPRIVLSGKMHSLNVRGSLKSLKNH